MLENITEISILYDLYGELLPAKQREIFRLYHEDNYSLSEIGQEFGITRQGVHEAVKRSEERLNEYEEKLGLAKKFRTTGAVLDHLEKKLACLLEERHEDRNLAGELAAMRDAIAALDR